MSLHIRIPHALIVLSVVLSAIPADAQLRRGEPADVGMDPAVLDEIPAMLEEAIDQGQISGAVTLVAKDGRIVHLGAVGRADLETGRPMRGQTLFAVASMTKPISATALMILQDEGKLSIDDPVSKYIPEFKSAALKDGPAQREVTLRDMLTHTSGLGGEQRVVGSLEANGRELAARPLAFQPGSKWQYSPGLNVCGRAIEVVTGQSYAEFLRERIFEPLGMNSTTFHPDEEQRKRIAVLYGPGEAAGTLKPVDHWLVDLSSERVANPSGGLFSTAADMARFYQMILNGGTWRGTRIVSEESVKAMTGLQTGELETGFTPGNGWGLGWCHVQKPQGVSEMLSPGTYGHGGAFGTQGWVDPQRKMIFVLMIQRTGFGNSDGSELRKKFQAIAVRSLR